MTGISVWSLAVCLTPQGTALSAGALFGVDLEGHRVELAGRPARVIVLFFTASDCPIANRYEPEMVRLEKKFGPAAVEFWWVYPNPGDSSEVVRRHEEQFFDQTHVLRDVSQQLTHAAHATVTPEAAVFLPEGDSLRVVYSGRIDDRYIAFGQERPRALRHDLDDAIASALAGQRIPRPAGPAIGCSIVPLEIRNR